MSLLKKNVFSNYLGSLWSMAMGLAFIPIYIQYLGIESYGLIGIFITFQAIIILFDIGLSATLTREVARLTAKIDKVQEINDLVYSIQNIYLAIGIIIGISIYFLSPFIVQYWITGREVSVATIEQSIRIMGFIIAFQWPASLYSGGLIGLQKHVFLNAIIITMSTLRGLGAVLVILLISPTIQAFFIWQIIISIINTSTLSLFFWRTLPQPEKKATFQKHLVSGIWRFALGMSVSSILGIILSQLDKVILSKILSLEMFGYYVLAGTIAMSLKNLLNPISIGIYPKLVQLATLQDQNELKQFYHQSSQLISVAIIPATVVIALFSNEIIFLWTQNALTAEKTHLLASILVCGSGLSGLMQSPGLLYQAFGKTRLSIYINAISVILIVPIIIILSSIYGALGGAYSWVILNVAYVFIAAQFIFQSTLPTEKTRWYLQDIGLPLMISVSTAGLGRLLVGVQSSQLLTIFFLSIVSLITLTVTAILTPATRAMVINMVFSVKIKIFT